MDFDPNQSIEIYQQKLERGEDDTLIYDEKLRDLSEKAKEQSALARIDRDNKQVVAEVIDEAHDLCEDFGSVTGSEFATMGEVLRNCAQVELAHLRRYNDGALHVDDERFAEILLDDLHRLTLQSDRLPNRLGMMEIVGTLSRHPNIEEPLDDEDEHGEREPPKKQTRRVNRGRANHVPPERKIQGRTVEQVDGKRDESLQKAIDHVKSSLRRRCRESPTHLVDYYRFVVDPHNFADTIENMFYVSFLVRDKLVKVSVDDRSGMPQIGTNRGGGGEQDLQHITMLDPQTWKTLVKKMRITGKMITRRNQEGDGA